MTQDKSFNDTVSTQEVVFKEKPLLEQSDSDQTADNTGNDDKVQ